MISLRSIHGRRRPVNLFLAEIIVALLFFSISGAVILRIFAAADGRSRQSARLERVVIFAQSFAEAYSETGDIAASADIVAKTAEISDDGNAVLRLENGKVIMRADEQRTETAAGRFSELKMTFSSDGEEIYTLSCSAYIPAGGG